MNTFKLIVLGGGAVVSEFHLPALAGLGWLDRTMVAEPSAGARERLIAAFPGVTVLAADYKTALHEAKQWGATAALVALPNALHDAATSEAIEAGLDVLCEKPLALTAEACRRLGLTAERHHRLLAVAMVRRFHPALQAARRVLAADWLGRVKSVTVEWGGAFAWPSESGHYFRAENAGVLANVGVHTLDSLEWLFGPLVPVSYTDDWGGGAEANATFELKTPGGVPILVRLSYTHTLANTVRIEGEHGDVQFAHDSPSLTIQSRTASLHGTLEAVAPFSHGNWPSTLESCFREQMAAFADAVQTRRVGIGTAADAARTADLIDWAYAHHRPTRVSARGASPTFEGRRVFVTGGTGFVGGHLVEALSATGCSDVVMPVRSYRTGATAGRFPVQMRRTSLLDPAGLREAMAGSQHVFHLAFGRDGDDTKRATIDGTRQVVEAAIAVGAESVVVVSSTSILGAVPGTEAADERSPYAPKNDYERTKAEAERVALAIAQRTTSTRIVVVQPSCVYGPRGGAFTELPARLRRDGAFCLVDGGRGAVNFVYVKNLVDALLLAATAPNAHGERFIASDGTTSWRNFFAALLDSDLTDLPSYTPQELAALNEARTPGLRDLARAVVGDAEVRRVIREHRRLAGLKAFVKRTTPSLFEQVRRQGPASAAASPVVEARPIPPAWLADLFGTGTVRISTDKATRVLGWSSRRTFDAGVAESRAWLHDVGLVTTPGQIVMS